MSIDVLPPDLARRLWALGWRPEGEHLVWRERTPDSGSFVLDINAHPVFARPHWLPTCSPTQALDWLVEHKAAPQGGRIAVHFATSVPSEQRWQALGRGLCLYAETAAELVAAILTAVEQEAQL